MSIKSGILTRGALALTLALGVSAVRAAEPAISDDTLAASVKSALHGHFIRVQALDGTVDLGVTYESHGAPSSGYGNVGDLYADPEAEQPLHHQSRPERHGPIQDRTQGRRGSRRRLDRPVQAGNPRSIPWAASSPTR